MKFNNFFYKKSNFSNFYKIIFYLNNLKRYIKNSKLFLIIKLIYIKYYKLKNIIYKIINILKFLY